VKDELISAAAKSAPPVSVSAWQYFLGLPVEKWVAGLTLLYILVQIYCLIVDRIEKRNAAKIARMVLRHDVEMDRQHTADTGGGK
jgi:hypothetical protein